MGTYTHIPGTSWSVIWPLCHDELPLRNVWSVTLFIHATFFFFNFFPLCLLGQVHSCLLPIHFKVSSHQQCGWALKRAPRAWQETIHSSVTSLHGRGPLKAPSVRMEGTSESWLLAAQPVSATSEPFRPLPGHCRTVSKAISHWWWKPEQFKEDGQQTPVIFIFNFFKSLTYS